MKIWLIVVGLLILVVIFYFIRNFRINWKVQKAINNPVLFSSKEEMDKVLESLLGEKRKPVKENWFRKWFLLS